MMELYKEGVIEQMAKEAECWDSRRKYKIDLDKIVIVTQSKKRC